MLSWLNRRLRNRMSGGVRGRKFLNQRNFLLLDYLAASFCLILTKVRAAENTIEKGHLKAQML